MFYQDFVAFSNKNSKYLKEYFDERFQIQNQKIERFQIQTEKKNWYSSFFSEKKLTKKQEEQKKQEEEQKKQEEEQKKQEEEQKKHLYKIMNDLKFFWLIKPLLYSNDSFMIPNMHNNNLTVNFISYFYE
jgi:hypothetical protein